MSSAATQKAHPVYSCILFSLTLQEGIALANDSRVGLASYFFSQDVSQERNYIKLSKICRRICSRICSRIISLWSMQNCNEFSLSKKPKAMHVSRQNQNFKATFTPMTILSSWAHNFWHSHPIWPNSFDIGSEEFRTLALNGNHWCRESWNTEKGQKWLKHIISASYVLWLRFFWAKVQNGDELLKIKNYDNLLPVTLLSAGAWRGGSRPGWSASMTASSAARRPRLAGSRSRASEGKYRWWERILTFLRNYLMIGRH